MTSVFLDGKNIFFGNVFRNEIDAYKHNSSAENQKGTIHIDFVQRYIVPFWLSTDNIFLSLKADQRFLEAL